MSKGTILFADNDRAFLEARQELLAKAGYEVVAAFTPEEANDFLTARHIDVVILDIRLRNDNDENDESGLAVAKAAAQSLPKIILTNFPDAEVVKKAYGYDLRKGSIPVEFVAKQEGSEKLLQTIQEVMRRNVFIVHGHDELTREVTARFVHEYGLHPVILSEQVGRGRNIMQMLQDHANVGFAIALLTPDDVGEEVTKRGDLKLRARQNVILELGYFIGKLGAHRVCALYKSGVEIPSDYLGVQYISLDGDWRFELTRVMRAADL